MALVRETGPVRHRRDVHPAGEEGLGLASVTCTVTAFGWLEFNPEVVLQQTGALTCLNW